MRTLTKECTLLLLTTLLAFLASACAEEDNRPPAAPWVDAVRSPTSLPAQVITGSAEYGSTVTITGGAETATTTADFYTAAFAVEVRLTPDAENALSVTATDSAGNESEATAVTIAHESAHPESLVLTIDPPVVSADVGQLTAAVRISNDEVEVALSDFVIDFTLGGDFTGAEQVTTDEDGRAQVTFTGLTTIGSGTLTATWVEPDVPEDPIVFSATREFRVVGGAPVQVDLTLSDGGEPTDDLTTMAGTEVTARTVVTDTAGNELDLTVTLSTDAPALLDGNRLLYLTRAGDYTVVATVAGTWVTDSALLHVTPDAPANVELQLSDNVVTAGESAAATTAAYDRFGNVVPGETFTLAIDPLPAVPADPFAGGVITVESPAGLYTVRATLDSDDTLFAEAPLMVLPAAVVIFTVELDDADLPDDVPSAALTVDPGSDVNITVTIQDVFGNDVDVPFFLSTDAPGAILDGVLTGVTRSGVYTVVGTLHGTTDTAAATLTVAPGSVMSASIELDSGLVTAGTTVTATATAYDDWGNVLPGETFTYSVIEAVTSPLDPVVDNAITIESPAGAFTVRATLDSDNGIFADADLTVVPGPVATFNVELDDADDPGDPLTDNLTVDPDSGVNITVTIQDAYGNDVDSPFSLSTDAPGAILDAVLTGVTQAGSYTVVATRQGTADTAAADLTVEPGPPVSIALDLDSDQVAAGTTVTASATALDAWGNAVPGETFTFSVIEPVTSPASPVVNNQITIESPAGAFTVHALLDSDNGITADAPLLVVPGPMATFTLELDDADDPGDVPAASLTVDPDSPVNITVTIQDVFGNDVEAPFFLSTDAPGNILDAVLSSVTQPGDYTVLATRQGTADTAAASLTVVPGPPVSAGLALDQDAVTAGTTVTASATAFDAWGNAVPGETFTYSVIEPVTSPASPVLNDQITIESPAGAFTVHAVLDSDNGITADAPLLVVPGPVATFTLELDDADDPVDVPAASLTVDPDSPVNITITIQDSYGNDVDASFSLSTDAPGAILDSVLTGVTRAGSYMVLATRLGTADTAAADLTVEPGPPVSIALGLDKAQVTAGTTVTASATALDAWGNAVPGETFTFSVIEAVTSPLTPVVGNSITIESPAGAFTVHAVLDSDNGITADAPLLVVPGPVATFTLELDDADDPVDVPAVSLTVGPDANVNITVTIEDAFGNAVDSPFFLSTDAPGTILDAVLSGVTRVGSYVVIATRQGTTDTASADLTVVPGAPAAASVVLDQSEVTAGTTVTATATALDAWGNAVPGETFTYSVLEPVTSPLAPVAGNQITIESPAGAFTVRATLDSDGSVTADAPLVVNPGAPDPAGFVFNLLDAGVPADPLNLTAGVDADFEYSVADSYGNPISPVVVDVSINAPGSLVANNNIDGGVISMLRVAGSYTAAAQVRGTNVVRMRGLNVAPAAADRIDLTLSTNLVSLGDPVTVFFTVTDVYGNQIPSPSVMLSCSDLTATFSGDPLNAVSGDQVTINQPGTYSITATETTKPDSDTEYVTAEQAMDFVPPVVTIDSPADGSEFSPGSPVIVTVSASDTGGLSKVGYRTRGVVEDEDYILEPPGTNAVTETFSFSIPSNRYGQITIYAWAEDEAGNSSNANPVTIYSQLPNTIFCPTCDSFFTAAAGYDEGGILDRGEGGIRDPREIAVGSGGEIYVAMFTNIQLTRASGFLGTDAEEVYISMIMPDGTVDPFAILTDNNDIVNQETVGLAIDPVGGTLYASLGDDLAGSGDARVIAFPVGGSIIDPYSNAVGFRELGLFFTGGRMIAVDSDPGPNEAYTVDPGPVMTTLLVGPNNNMFDTCGSDTVLYVTSAGRLDTCDLTIDGPSWCTALTLASNDPDLAGALRSCAISPTGQVIVANRGDGTVVSVDPSGIAGSNATVIISGMQQPVGVAFDPNTGDLLVSDEAMDAVFRFLGAF